jgi:hypothetical protein
MRALRRIAVHDPIETSSAFGGRLGAISHSRTSLEVLDFTHWTGCVLRRQMQRREVITLLVGAAVTWSLAARSWIRRGTELEQGGMMSITAHSRTAGDTGAKARLPMLAPSLAALLYPFALKGFNASVTRIPDVGAGAIALS